MTDRDRLNAECSALFSRKGEPLTPQHLPVLCELAKERAGIELDELSVPTAVSQALLRAAVQADAEHQGLLIGARAYLLLDGGPDRDEAAQIRRIHAPRSASAGSQALRFSWARWQQKRHLEAGRAVPAPNERTGRNQRDTYAAALADSLWAILQKPGGLRSALRSAPHEGEDFSPAFRSVMADSILYARDVRPEPALLVHREEETALVAALTDHGRPWPRVVIGEAGIGKSTLLWAVQDALADNADVLPVLLSAGWFLEYTDRHDIADLAALLTEPRERGRQTVMLLDTVDTLVHDDRSRHRLLRLLDELLEVSIPMVFACRPREAALLTHPELRTHHLDAYTDIERDAAVRALARQYLSVADENRVALEIASAHARGLPVEDVSRNPLLLWMMFDLAAPAAPALADIDVTSLFRAYWDYRIARDVRGPVERLSRDGTQDMSASAGAAAAVLLTVGAPDLSLDELRAGVDTLTRQSGAGRDLDVLRERGVLTDLGPHVGFFHQTLFEYTAAQALLARDPVQALSLLAARAVGGGGDLFVAAVWEQALILAGHNPLYRPALRGLSEQIEETHSPIADAALLVAWAHHPQAVQLPESLPARVDLSAVVRAAQIIPAVATGSPRERAQQLLALLASRDDKQLWMVGLEGLTRLVARDPAVATGLVELIRDALHSPHADFLAAVFDLIAVAAPSDPVAIRAAVLTEAADPSHGTLKVMLKGLARLWPILGDAEALDAAIRAVADRDWGNQFLPPLGSVIAAEWDRQDADVVSAVTAATDIADLPESSAVVFAASEYLTGERNSSDVDELVRILVEGLPPALFDAGKEALRTLLGSESPSALEAERRIKTVLSTVGADAQRNRLTPVQQHLLTMLSLNQLSPGLLARVLPARLDPRDWSAAPALSRLAPIAADQGHAAARRFLNYLASTNVAADAVIDAVFAASTLFVPVHDGVFDLLVTIALKHRRTSSADKLVTSIPYRSPRAATHAARILAYANERLDSTDTADAELGLVAALMSRAEVDLQWDGIARLLERVHDPRWLAPLLDALWAQTPPGDTSRQLEFLSQFIRVDPDARVPVARVRGDTPIGVAVSAAKAYQRILGHRATATPNAWPALRALTLYDVESEDIFFNGSRFVVACDYLSRLADDHPAQTGPFLRDLLSAAITGKFVSITLRLWAREAGTVILKCFRTGGMSVRDLADLCLGPLDEDVARLVMSVLADADYAHARAALLDLAQRAEEPRTRANAAMIVREHDRQRGTGSFAEVQELFAEP